MHRGRERQEEQVEKKGVRKIREVGNLNEISYFVYNPLGKMIEEQGEEKE